MGNGIGGNGMIEPTMYKVTIEFTNGDTITLEMTNTEVDTMFDKLWDRDPIKWMNIWEHIINFEDVRYINYVELEEEE